MARVTNHELVNRIIVATDEDRIDWRPTARPQEFSASFGGKWTVILSQEYEQGQAVYDLDVKDSEGEILLRITSFNDNRIPGLHEQARRRALKIDEPLTDLLNEIEKPKK